MRQQLVIFLFSRIDAFLFSRIDTESPKVQISQKKPSKLEVVQAEMKSILEQKMDAFSGAQEQKRKTAERLSASMDYARILAKSLAELDPKDEKIVRAAFDRIIFQASMGYMDLAEEASGLLDVQPINFNHMVQPINTQPRFEKPSPTRASLIAGPSTFKPPEFHYRPSYMDE